MEETLIQVLNELKDMRNDMSGLRKVVAEIMANTSGNKLELAELKLDVIEIKAGILAMKKDITELKNDVVGLKNSVKFTWDAIKHMEKRMAKMEGDVRQIIREI